MDLWTSDQVIALAPDSSSAAAGRALAAPGPWSSTGACADPPALWGDCRGSGKTPYRTIIDLADPAGPAYRCSCPSRKFPCKHALGLLLLWSGGGVPDGDTAPEHVAEWITGRRAPAARPARKAAGGAGGGVGSGTAGSETADAEAGVGDPAAAARRAAERERRMTSGLAELEQWLRDQVRGGLAGTDAAGYAPFERLAARMVDAQLPGVASVVRRLAGDAASGEGWQGRLLAEYALLHLLARTADPVLARGDAPRAATVRAHLGVPVPSADVLATPGVRDDWWVLARRDDQEDRLTVRRVWLAGRRTGRLALVLSFAPEGRPLDASLAPGTVLDADVHAYPGAVPLRVVVGTRHAPARRPAAGDDVPGIGLAAALDRYADALAADPWLRAWPVVVSGVVPVVEESPDGVRWWLTDADGSLPVVGAEPGWGLLAQSGGRPLTVLVELVPGGVRPVGALSAADRAAGVAR